MGINSANSVPFSLATSYFERQVPVDPIPEPGPVRPTPAPRPVPAPLILAAILGDSLVQRGVVSRSDLAQVTQLIQQGPDVIDPATGGPNPARVLRLAVSFANEALIDFIRGMGPVPAPNEDAYRTVLRGFITRISNGEADRVMAHVEAHVAAMVADDLALVD